MKTFHIFAMTAALLLALPTTSMAESGSCEWSKGHAKQGHMKRADTNGDGKVDKQEFIQAAEKRFSRMDINHDGALDKNDHTAYFDRMDSNHDGNISREEFQSAHEKRHNPCKK